MVLTEVLAIRRLLIVACATACSSAADPNPDAMPVSQGMVAGSVQDEAGGAVANAAVCATAVFEVNDVPSIVVRTGSTSANGTYTIPINFTYEVDVHAAITVAATPSATSGLQPAYESGNQVLITTAIPPAETTRVNLVVIAGTPASSVLCLAGPTTAASVANGSRQ